MNDRMVAMTAALLLALPTLATGSASPAPQFTLAARGGRDVSLAQYRGQVVMINFWASWCGPCRQEMPLLEGIYKKYRSADVCSSDLIRRGRHAVDGDHRPQRQAAHAAPGLQAG